jgi:ribosome-associated heat shock protein Hsp15
MKSSETDTAMRLDKWLWAARFFKTRALAQKHIELGRVLVNGAKVKNSKNISAGDTLDLTLNSLPTKSKCSRSTTSAAPRPKPASFTKKTCKPPNCASSKNCSIKPVAPAPPIPTGGRPSATAAK